MAPQVRPLALRVTSVNSYLKYTLYFPDIGPKFYNVRPSALTREERGDEVVEMGIDEEVNINYSDLRDNEINPKTICLGWILNPQRCILG